MTTKQRKKTKMKTTDPIEVDSKLVIAQYPDQALRILDTYGVAVVPLNVDGASLKQALKETKFYNTANAIFKDEFKVAEPTMEEKQNPATYQKRKAGDDAQGMLHQYGTPIHHLLQDNSRFRQTMTALYGGEINYSIALNMCTNIQYEIFQTYYYTRIY